MNTKLKKWLIPLSVAVTAAVLATISLLLLGGRDSSADPISSTGTASATSSEVSVIVPDIAIPDKTADTTVSEPTSSITVEGAPDGAAWTASSSSASSNKAANSSKPATPPASNKPTPPVSSKPPASSTPSSQPEPPPESKPTDPGNPSQGTIKIEGDRQYIFLDGKWWDDGLADKQVVDDSDKTYPPCEVCGQPSGYCTCRVGF